MKAIIASLQKQMESAANTEEPEKPEETKKAAEPELPRAEEETKAAVGPGQPGAASGPVGKSRWPGVVEDGQVLFDQCLNEALRATARQDYEAAVEAYREIERLYIRYGNSETTIKTDVIIESLKKLMEEGNTDG